MKVNSIGINTYQQLNDKQQVNRRPLENSQTKPAAKIGKVNIPVQSDKVGSDLAVKLPGENYMEMLSAEEKEAFEMVFKKFNGSSGASGQNGLGRFVDVKL